MTAAYSVLGRLVVLALVLMFVTTRAYSGRSRLIVSAVYLATVVATRLYPALSLATLLAQTALGIALVLARRWEKGADSIF